MMYIHVSACRSWLRQTYIFLCSHSIHLHDRNRRLDLRIPNWSHTSTEVDLQYAVNVSLVEHFACQWQVIIDTRPVSVELCHQRIDFFVVSSLAKKNLNAAASRERSRNMHRSWINIVKFSRGISFLHVIVFRFLLVLFQTIKFVLQICLQVFCVPFGKCYFLLLPSVYSGVFTSFGN